MNDATDIIDSILDGVAVKKTSGTPVTTEYTGKLISIDTATAKKVIGGFLGKLPVKITTGSRYDASLSYAGILWACGYPADDIKQELIKFDKDKNSPPKNNTEDIDKILKFIVTCPQGYRERKKKEVAPAAAPADATTAKKAKILYEKGKFIPYCKNVLRKIWYQDSYILQGLMYVAASFRLQNPDEGLHLHVAGDTQSGKSGSAKASLTLIHPNDRITRTFSPRWIFYADGEIHENTILFSDDTVFDEDVAEVYRNVLTSWHDGVLHGTVINQAPKNLTIPRHVSLVLTSIESVCKTTADAQDESRFLTLEIHRSADQEREIREFIQQKKEDVSHHIRVIHEVWNIIPKKPVILHKSFDNEFPVREFKRYLTLLKCNALLYNRDVTTEQDVEDVKAFLSYSKPLIDSKTAAYTRNERAVIDALNGVWQTPNDLKKGTGMPQASIFRALRGKAGTFERPEGGLLVKDKALEMQYNADRRSHEFKH